MIPAAARSTSLLQTPVGLSINTVQRCTWQEGTTEPEYAVNPVFKTMKWQRMRANKLAGIRRSLLFMQLWEKGILIFGLLPIIYGGKIMIVPAKGAELHAADVLRGAETHRKAARMGGWPETVAKILAVMGIELQTMTTQVTAP